MTSPAVPNLEHTYPWEYMSGLLRGHENNIKKDGNYKSGQESDKNLRNVNAIGID